MTNVKTALMFPGQGSQFVGMGKDLCEAFPTAEAVFNAADEILGRPLSDIMFNGPVEDLNTTINTQPAIYIMNHACYALYADKSGPFDFALGHSLGEYNALTAAGVFDFKTALDLIGRRAELMQEEAAENPGKMLAVLGLEDETVSSIIGKAAGTAVVANYNCPGQVVVSGDAGAMEAVRVLLTEAGARRVVELKVSGAFHSPLMNRAQSAMAAVLDGTEFADGETPVCSNYSAQLSSDAGTLKEALKNQITGSVRWTESILNVAAGGAERFVETGPSAVLTGLAKRTLGQDTNLVNINSVETVNALREVK